METRPGEAALSTYGHWAVAYTTQSLGLLGTNVRPGAPSQTSQMVLGGFHDGVGDALTTVATGAC